ncbi:DNA-directed RNA polymerase subunit delta [Thalassobacillus sp. CUG 92003]|uniref:DNA-directed RNA polymerase subunit delta n=1 Tax=Thalassobacillus sp. CUG 92003 TaxID=2736641 RepID=UPI0015E72669|nr:DNA-directed RNA polymerase subunit delta [Thalassobacillus sp. CUG 92003]
MSLKELNKEQISEISMLELATTILEEENQAIDFNELFKRIASLKGLSKEQTKDAIAQFYTDMNIDGRFMTIGTNQWGLKRWYPVEQMEEEIANLPKKRKKKKKKKKKPSQLLEDEVGASGYDDEESKSSLDESSELTDDDLDLDDEEDYEGDYEEDDLDEEEEEVIEEDVSFVGDEDEEESDDDL